MSEHLAGCPQAEQHPDYDWMGCECDAILEDMRELAEERLYQEFKEDQQ